MMKNDFYFMLKALFVLNIFKIFVLTSIYVHAEKRLDKKANVNFKPHDAIGKQQIITIHSRSKGTQTMKFGQ